MLVQQRQFPEYQGYYTCFNYIVDMDELVSYKVTGSSSHWQKAMQEEIDALHMQGTWLLVPNPNNRNIVGSKCIFKIKKNLMVQLLDTRLN